MSDINEAVNFPDLDSYMESSARTIRHIKKLGHDGSYFGLAYIDGKLHSITINVHPCEESSIESEEFKDA